MKIIIEKSIDNSKWKEEKWLTNLLMKNIVKNILNRFSFFSYIKTIEISMLFTDNEKMKELKKEFFNNPVVTNVLSFPDAITSKQQLLELPDNLDYIYLGDIALGYQILQKEAEKLKKSFKDHFIHLFTHSILHLIGFDHKTKKEANIMESLETDVLKDFNLLSPY